MSKSTTDTITIPDEARPISYANTDYTSTLRRIFEGVQSKEDLAAVLGGSGGSVQLVNSGTVSSTDEYFAITGMSTEYPLFWIDFDGVLVDEASKKFSLLTRKDGDSTPEEGASDYGWVRWGLDTTTPDDDGSVADSEIQMMTLAGSTAGTNEHMTGRIIVYNPGDAARFTILQWDMTWTSGSVIHSSMGTGVRDTQQADDAVYFLTDGVTPTTFDQGNYRLYGLKQ